MISITWSCLLCHLPILKSLKNSLFMKEKWSAMSALNKIHKSNDMLVSNFEEWLLWKMDIDPSVSFRASSILISIKSYYLTWFPLNLF